MASLRQIRRRIRSVGSTKQITKAMQMVAASRLKRAQTTLENFRPYAFEISALAGRLSCSSHSPSGRLPHKFFIKRDAIKNTALVLFIGDKGLCGSYNANILKKADEFLRNYKKGTLSIILVGKKGFGYLRKKEFALRDEFIELGNRIDTAKPKRLSEFLSKGFVDGAFDEVYIQYAKFVSIVSYEITVKKLFPLEKETLGACTEEDMVPNMEYIEYIYEPDRGRILEELMPKYVETQVSLSMCEAITSEQSARMVAMKQATDNADDMINRLTLVRNKVRQASITKEIIEITSGAEAIK